MKLFRIIPLNLILSDPKHQNYPLINRKGLSPIVSTVLLLSVSLFLSLTVSSLYRETTFANVKVESLEYSYIYCASESGVFNAKWNIVFQVKNRGTQSLQLTNLYINEKEVDVYGLVHGDSLADSSMIGTSFPEDGLNLGAGEGVELYIWVGADLFSSGTTLIVNMNPINNSFQYKSIKVT